MPVCYLLTYLFLKVLYIRDDYNYKTYRKKDFTGKLPIRPYTQAKRFLRSEININDPSRSVGHLYFQYITEWEIAKHSLKYNIACVNIDKK